MKKSKCFFRVLTIFLLFVSTASADIQLDGTWYLRSLCTQKDGQADNFGYDTGIFTFEPNDSFTGVMTSDDGSSWPESGKAIPAEDGTIYIVFYENPNVVFNAAGNVHRDVMSDNVELEDGNGVCIDVFVKKGDSYATSDLEGVWYDRGLKTQRNGYPDSFGYDSGTFTFQNDGNFVANWVSHNGDPWTETGTASVDSNGIVTLNFDGGGTTEAGLNANKNVMIYNWKLVDAPENEFGFDIMVKKSDSYSSQDLVGTWFYKSLETQLNNQPDNFGYNTGVMNIEDDGTFSLVITDSTSSEIYGMEYGEGTASIDPNGVVSLSFTDEPLVLTPVMGVSKDIMVNNYTDPNDEVGIEIFVKKVSADISGDGIVNFIDLARLANHWLEGIEP